MFMSLSVGSLNTTPQSLEKIEVESCIRRLVKAVARQLFETHPDKVHQRLLDHKFSPLIHLELVKLLAKSGKNNSQWVTDNITALAIEDQKERAALAKIAAHSFAPTENPAQLRARMNLTKKYSITDPKVVVEIVKILIEDNSACALYLNTLKGLDQRHLTEIIKHSICCSPYAIHGVPKNLITDLRFMAEIFLTCVKAATYPARVFHWIDFPKELQNLKKAYQLILGPGITEDKLYVIPTQEVMEYLLAFAKENFPDFTLTCLNEILENKKLSKHEIRILLSNLAWTLELMTRKLTPKQAYWILQQELLRSILTYRDPALRYSLSETVVQVAQSDECKMHYEALNRHAVKHTKLANLFLAQMKSQGVLISEVSPTIAKHHLREANHKKLLIETLMSVRDSDQLSSSDKTHLMQHIFKNGSESASNMYRALGILEWGPVTLLKESTLTSLVEAQKLAEIQKIKTLFDREVTPENIVKYDQLFSRNPSALFIYAAKVHRLPRGTSYKQPLIKCLQDYLHSILEGNFEKMRYEKVKNPHLSTVFPENAQECFASWKKGEIKPLEELLPTSHFLELNIDFEKVMQEGFRYIRHLPHINYVERFFKATPGEMRNAIKKELGLAIQHQRRNPKHSSQENPLQHLLFAQSIIDLSKQKLTDYTRKANGLRKKIDNVYEMAKKICPEIEFLNLVEGLHQVIPKMIKPGAYQHWTIEDTDHPQDLLLSGTEVIGSCQHVNGNIALNRCLPAYLIDGKNRLLAIKDSRGKIRMRAIFRILWDPKNAKPALFMEKIYPLVAPSELMTALTQFAIARAKQLKLALFEGDVDRDPISIHSLGGPAPFEYVDALRSTQEKSTFQIYPSNALYMP